MKNIQIYVGFNCLNNLNLLAPRCAIDDDDYKCKICCWDCEFLSECYEKWIKKPFSCFCKKENTSRWCSSCRDSYKKLMNGEIKNVI